LTKSLLTTNFLFLFAEAVRAELTKNKAETVSKIGECYAK
jgi:hypothetical protein